VSDRIDADPAHELAAYNPSLRMLADSQVKAVAIVE